MRTARIKNAAIAITTPTYITGDKTSFNNKNPSTFAKTIDMAPNRAIVCPSSIFEKTYNWPNIATLRMRKYPKNHKLKMT